MKASAVKTALPWLTKSLNVLLAVLLAGLGGGCSTIQNDSLTYALWSDSGDNSQCRPQADPDLKLFDSENPPDVLAEYNAVSDRSKSVQRRAYFLGANSRRLAAGKPPRFVDVRRQADLAPIPVVASTSNSNAPVGATNPFAVCHGGSFILYRPESSPEYCTLPCYQDVSVGTRCTRVALTPFTVTTDVVVGVAVIGVVVGVVGGVAFLVGCCESNVSWRP